MGKDLELVSSFLKQIQILGVGYNSFTKINGSINNTLFLLPLQNSLINNHYVIILEQSRFYNFIIDFTHRDEYKTYLE